VTIHHDALMQIQQLTSFFH